MGKRELLIAIAEELGLANEAEVLKNMVNDKKGSFEYLKVDIPYEVIEGISFNGNFYEMDEFTSKFKKEWPSLVEDKWNITLIVNTSTGEVINWPHNSCGEFRTIKVVDCGTYTLFKDNCGQRDVIASYDGYVPKCLEIEDDGFGDYLEFTITNGVIDNWSFTNDMREEIMNYA